MCHSGPVLRDSTVSTSRSELLARPSTSDGDPTALAESTHRHEIQSSVGCLAGLCARQRIREYLEGSSEDQGPCRSGSGPGTSCLEDVVRPGSTRPSECNHHFRHAIRELQQQGGDARKSLHRAGCGGEQTGPEVWATAETSLAQNFHFSF